MSQDSQQKNTSSARTRRAEELPSDPIGCYLPLIGFVLVLSFAVYVVVVMSVSIYSIRASTGVASTLLDFLSLLIIWFQVPLAAFFAWLLSGLMICFLLLFWFKRQRIQFLVMLAIVIIWWGISLAGYVHWPPEPAQLFQDILRALLWPYVALAVPAEQVGQVVEQAVGLIILILHPASFLILSVGAWGLPMLQCWRPRSLSTLLLVFAWPVVWLIMMFGLREYRVGIVLLFSLVTNGVGLWVGLYLASGYLLPLADKSRRSDIFRFTRDWVQGVNLPGYVVVDELYEEDRVEERVPGDRFSEYCTAPGFIISDCNYAVAVSSNTKFKGVKGPGVTFTRYADQVMRTVDLRPQLRAFPVEAVTKDGIQIRSLIFTPCRIDSRDNPPRLGERLPYRPYAGWEAIRAQEMRHQGPQQTPDSKKRYGWEELSCLIATRIFQDIISRYKFDDLYGPYQLEEKSPRQVIADELMERVRGELKELGIELVGGGISDLQPADPAVYVKRAQNWKEEWKHKIALQKSESQAEWLRMVERVRLEAQAELILDLGRRLEASMVRAELRSQAALDQFVKLLDELMKQQPTLEEVVPEETVEALWKFRRSIG